MLRGALLKFVVGRDRLLSLFTFIDQFPLFDSMAVRQNPDGCC
jgi:hypothetical protein